MKRIFILASAATVALASCSETHVVYKEAPTEIGFRQITGVMTKADGDGEGDAGTSNGRDLDAEVAMGVFANFSKGTTPEDKAYKEYFGNTKFAQQDGETNWTAEPAQYYPLQSALDFAYYAPYITNQDDATEVVDNATRSYDASSNTMKLTYNDVTSTDVLFGRDVIINQGKTSEALDVTLKHALAQITIKAYTNVADVFTFNSLKLTGIYKKGMLKVEYETSETDNNNRLDLTSADWTEKESSAGSHEFVKNDSDSEDTPAYAVPTTSTVVGSPIYIIPSNYNEQAESEKIEQGTIEIEYTITTGNNQKHSGLKATLDLSDDTATKAYWEMGKHYTYTIYVTADEIKFAPEVEEMENVPASPAEEDSSADSE